MVSPGQCFLMVSVTHEGRGSIPGQRKYLVVGSIPSPVRVCAGGNQPIHVSLAHGCSFSLSFPPSLTLPKTQWKKHPRVSIKKQNKKERLVKGNPSREGAISFLPFSKRGDPSKKRKDQSSSWISVSPRGAHSSAQASRGIKSLCLKGKTWLALGIGEST